MLDSSAVNAIADLAREAQAGEDRIVDVDGVPMSTTPLHDARVKEPEPKPLIVHTLTGLVAYAKANRDDVDLDDCVLHVVSPRLVALRGPLHGIMQQRFGYLQAEVFDRFAAVPSFGFGRWLPVADMVISLQALFEDTDARAKLLALLGNVRSVGETATEDDGVTQRVSAKAGIHLVQEIAAPPQWLLRPYRTFPEVEQPASPFVLRLKQVEQTVHAALFEADGGAWQHEAMQSIAAYLADELPDLTVLA
jgi:hypothetical protein